MIHVGEKQFSEQLAIKSLELVCVGHIFISLDGHDCTFSERLMVTAARITDLASPHSLSQPAR
jgi:hypothetical protein